MTRSQGAIGITKDLALLAPVPLVHLEAGQQLANKGGIVAFGTNKLDFFLKLDKRRKGAPVPALIYPSHEDATAKNSYLVSWIGWYVEHVIANRRGEHPNGTAARPASTETDDRWTAFWHVQTLRQLPTKKQIAIGKIETIKGGWRKDAPPRGPELVAMPESLVDEFWP